MSHITKGLSPAVRPAEWTVSITAVLVAVLLWSTDRNTAALVAAGMGALPVLLTAIFIAVKFPERYHPTEVVTAVVGIAGGIVLFTQDKDTGALAAVMMAFVPGLITIFTVTAPSPTPIEE